MAVGKSQSKVIDVASGTSGGVSITPTAGNLLVSNCRSGSQTGQTVGCSDGTNTWVQIDQIADANSAATVANFYVANVSSSTVTVTVTTTTSQRLSCTIDEFSGVATTNPLSDRGNSTDSNVAATTSTVTTSGSATNAGDLVVNMTSSSGSHTFTAGTLSPSGTEAITSQVPVVAATSRMATEWAAAGGGGAQTATFTWTNGTSGSTNLIATFKASTGGGPPPDSVVLFSIYKPPAWSSGWG